MAGLAPGQPTVMDIKADEPTLGATVEVDAEQGRGDAKPLRVVQGEKTGLDFPMGLAADVEHDEFAVANNGGNSVLVFSRTAQGNVAPVRTIAGSIVTMAPGGQLEHFPIVGYVVVCATLTAMFTTWKLKRGIERRAAAARPAGA